MYTDFGKGILNNWFPVNNLLKISKQTIELLFFHPSSPQTENNSISDNNKTLFGNKIILSDFPL